LPLLVVSPLTVQSTSHCPIGPLPKTERRWIFHVGIIVIIRVCVFLHSYPGFISVTLASAFVTLGSILNARHVFTLAIIAFVVTLGPIIVTIVVVTLGIWHACHTFIAIAAFVVTLGPIIIVVIIGIFILRRIIVITPAYRSGCSWTHSENHILHA
jgi:hypothetical protein